MRLVGTELNGRCLCGAVRYACGPPCSPATLCHCESCRRASGAPAVAWVTVERGAFRFTAGAPRELASSPPVRRTFCERCGTPLTYWHEQAPDFIDVTVATLEQAHSIAPADHTWMSDALPWDRPGDALPQRQRTRTA